MPHLAAGAALALAVEMQMGGRIGENLPPGFNVPANQVAHLYAWHDEPGRAERQAANGPDMVLELRGERALDRPVAAIVDPRRHLVEHGAVLGREEFEGQKPDIVERFRHPSG